ncbi:sugar transferase [Longitalea luteola]|uniref:sugar transferase n=1 Tax=Longitalea luteola TaxID=2812563 RepID=UPI001A96D5E7|nr:sugar transferase [Longitalea luteola]
MIREKRLPLLKRTILRKYVDTKRGYFVCKRILDVLFATVIIITVLSWLLPLLALLIKLTSKGPVFFLQKRTGRGGKSFTCYKLRTLIHNPVEHPKHMPILEEPVTALGRFLRQSNLDELPQFFNVLFGSMSIVGPRPHMHADCNAFGELIPGYKFRNLVKPGITGLAQVKGYHGKVISRECIIKRFEWDVWYVRHAGFSLDLYIITTTALNLVLFLVGMKKRTAEPLATGQDKMLQTPGFKPTLVNRPDGLQAIAEKELQSQNTGLSNLN